MVTRKMTVRNDFGLHARASAAVVNALDAFSSQIMVRRGDKCANARSILDLLLLGASAGSVIEVTAAGEDEELAIAALASLVLEGFGDTGLERGN